MGTFRFKQFTVDDSRCGMKIGTDGVLLGSWARAGNASSVIDAGTGSGLIALMMAQRYRHARIIGIDIDESSALDAKYNASVSPWSDRIEIINTDVLGWTPDNHTSGIGHPLCIISNPPFFTEALHSPDSSRSLARHGSGFGVGTLIQWASKIMTQKGDTLSFIAPADRDNEVQYQLSLSRLAAIRISDVMPRHDRKAIRRLYEVTRECDVKSPYLTETVTIREPDGSYTQQYSILTGQFYLDK